MAKKTKRLFEIDDLFRFQYAPEAQLSPDGKRLVYSIMRTDEPKDRQISNLWLMDLASGKSAQLTFGDWEDFSPIWSPDGRSLAFLSDRTGKVQVYLLHLEGGEAHQLTSLAQGVSGPICWSPGGERIAFCAPPEKPADLTKPYRVSRPVYRHDGPGYADPFIRQLYILELKSGKTKKLTSDGFNHTPLGWSPDGTEILEFTSMAPDTLSTRPNLMAVDLKGTSRQLLSNRDWTISNAAWLSDGRLAVVAFSSDAIYGTKSGLYVLNADGSEMELRTQALVNTISSGIHDDTPLVWGISLPPVLPSPDASDAIVPVMNGGQINLYQVSLRGPQLCREAAAGERFCFPLSRAGDNLVFGMATQFDPCQLALLDLTKGDERRLTSLNKDLLARIEMPELKNLHFPSSDGQMVEGWVLLPPQGKPPYPTVLHIHGGPHSIYGHSFYFDFQTLIGAGYAVLFVNQRGSEGYGDAFATAIHGDWGHLDYDDLMAGVDHAVALGIADPDRLGVCGVSGGGNLSCWIVGHTDRFKAAVPENPVTNFVSMYGTSDVGPTFIVSEMGGKPHEVPEVYARSSPITYAHRCKTPTLLVTAEQDYRCPSEQAEQFYTVLKANGCVVEMLRIPNNSHVGSTYGTFAARRAHNEALLEWFGRWVKGK